MGGLGSVNLLLVFRSPSPVKAERKNEIPIWDSGYDVHIILQSSRVGMAFVVRAMELPNQRQQNMVAYLMGHPVPSLIRSLIYQLVGGLSFSYFHSSGSNGNSRPTWIVFHPLS